MNRTSFVRIICIASAGIIALGAYAAIQDITLKRKAKAGDQQQFKVSAVFTTEQGDITFNQNRTEKVTAVKPDGGYVVEASSTDTKVVVAGMDMPSPDTKDSSEIGPDGLVQTITSEMPVDASSYRIANLQAFKVPDAAVKIGDEIKFEIPADKKKETPPVKAVYTVVGMEKVKDWDTVKLTFTAEETEGLTKSSAKGTIWVSVVDGSMVKSEATWKDVQPTGVPFPLNGKFIIERVK